MQQRFIRFSELQHMVGLGRTKIYDKIKAGTFPRQIRLGKAAAWVESEVQEWMREQINQSRHPAPHQQSTVISTRF